MANVPFSGRIRIHVRGPAKLVRSIVILTIVARRHIRFSPNSIETPPPCYLTSSSPPSSVDTCPFRGTGRDAPPRSWRPGSGSGSRNRGSHRRRSNPRAPRRARNQPLCAPGVRRPFQGGK
eukprot:1183433-Prorocentrum_minimum.AAC.2